MDKSLQQRIVAWKYIIKPYGDYSEARGITLKKTNLSDAIPKDMIEWEPVYASDSIFDEHNQLDTYVKNNEPID